MEIYNLTDKSVTIDFGSNKLKAYVNSARGRNQINADCSNNIVEKIFQKWGTTPTVDDPILSLEPQSHLSDTDIVGMQLVELMLGV